MTPRDLAKILSLPPLPEYLRQVEAELQKTVIERQEFSRPLRSAISGGKRLRPILTIASTASAGQKIANDVIKAAAAVELLHTASLIHDDIIDGSDSRRGRATVVRREGLGTAVLAGDFLLAKAIEQTTLINSAAGAVMAQAVADMCQGQAMELSPTSAEADYMKIIHLKAGTLTGAACQLGGLFNNAKTADTLKRYGEKFGAAFQIIDDIIDDDLPSGRQKASALTARQLCQAAAGELEALQPNPAVNGLAALPEYYLDWALPGQNAIV
ncbi:MAG TPA: polyprenyl synthetase family protein [Candidatus Saccharimonadales bacterium]|nr:polyprenyl synthetase family protein [Candidatus Saccharimonadales bacterium]